MRVKRFAIAFAAGMVISALHFVGQPFFALGFMIAGVGLTAYLCGRGPALLTLFITVCSVIAADFRNPLLSLELGVYVLAALGVTITLPMLRDRIRESEAKFRLLAESAPALFWMSDANNLITYVNKRWEDFSGKHARSAYGKGWCMGIHPEDVVRCTEEREIAFNARRFFSHEYRLQRADGEYRVVLDQGTPYWSQDGHFQGYIGTTVDITPQAQAEARLRQASKMEALGRLAGGISHDFNNVVGVIGTMNDLMIEEFDKHLPISRDDMVEIRHAARRARELTRQLSVFGRKERVEVNEVNLNQEIQSILKMIRSSLGANVKIGGALSPSLGPVKADPTMIEQIFLNLLLNARDAMPEGGLIMIETRNCVVRNERDLNAGPYAQVVFSDTGCGIPPESLGQIFEPFFTTKGTEKGSGLGLSTVYSAVHQLGGSIEVASTVGKGTTFTLRFPQPIRSTNSEVLPVKSSETILVVEDDPAVLNVVARALQQGSYRVLKADGGEAALDWISREAVHLVITDVTMPGIDGLQLAEKLQQQYNDLPIIFMSGNFNHRHVPPGRLIHKPFGAEDLLREVREVFQGRGTGPVYALDKEPEET